MNESPNMQPCSDACAAFQVNPTDPWAERGRCTRVDCPRRGFVVSPGTECAQFTPRTPDGDQAQPATSATQR